MCFFVDYWKLNHMSKFDPYPMPRVEEVLESVGATKFIPDLTKGYWQIPMAKKSQEKTAFTMPFDFYEFQLMPFGLHNALVTFQRTMNEVLCDCQSIH